MKLIFILTVIFTSYPAFSDPNVANCINSARNRHTERADILLEKTKTGSLARDQLQTKFQQSVEIMSNEISSCNSIEKSTTSKNISVDASQTNLMKDFANGLEISSRDKENKWILFKLTSADFFKGRSIVYFTSSEIGGKVLNECRKITIDSNLNYFLLHDGLTMKGKISLKDDVLHLSAEEITFQRKLMPKNNGSFLKLKSSAQVGMYSEDSKHHNKNSYVIELIPSSPYEMEGIFTSCSDDPVCSKWCK